MPVSSGTQPQRAAALISGRRRRRDAGRATATQPAVIRAALAAPRTARPDDAVLPSSAEQDYPRSGFAF
jgi:hypothetical protein